MKTVLLPLLLSLIAASAQEAGFVVGHTCTDLSQIPNKWITKTKADLHIVYEHTSHGSKPYRITKGEGNYEGGGPGGGGFIPGHVALAPVNNLLLR